jgi:hypothetical protein
MIEDALFELSMGDDFVMPLKTDVLKPASKKTITFADTIATSLVYQASETSLETLDGCVRGRIRDSREGRSF